MFKSVIALSALTLALPAPAAPKPTELHFGSEPWRLALSLGDLKPTEGAPSSADRHVYTYSNDRLEVLSVIVEDAHSPATLDSCRDVFARRKQGMPLVNEVQGESGDAATQEYDFKADFGGKAMVQHNAFSCRVRGNYYIDVHASKMDYRPSDRGAILARIDAVTIVE